MNKLERITILIDGSNFYHYLKDKQIRYPKGSGFNFKKFADFLVEERKLIAKKYYTGILKMIEKDPKSVKLYKGQQRFLDKLIKGDGFELVPGRIMYDKGRIREKGTDVKIAVADPKAPSATWVFFYFIGFLKDFEFLLPRLAFSNLMLFAAYH